MGDIAVPGASATTWLRLRALCAANPFGDTQAHVRAAHSNKVMMAARPEGRLGDGSG